MKILFFTHYSDLYGANKSILNLIDGLGQKIDPLVVLPFYGEMVIQLKKRNIPYFIRTFESAYEIPQKAKFSRFLCRLKHYPRLINLVRKIKPQIIYSNSSAIEYGLIISKLFLIRHIWHIREFGWKHYNIVHDYGNFLFRLFLSLSTINIAVSKQIKSEILRNKKNSRLVYNGPVGFKYIKSTPKKLQINSFVFGMIGFLDNGKNQIEGVEAFYHFQNRFPNSRLDIIGDGEEKYREKLFTMVESLSIQSKVVFKGYCESVFSKIENIDILLMCSKYEALGRVTIEAMSQGIPVIGRNSGGTPEIINHEINGLLYNGNAIDLTDKMFQLVDNPDLYETLSKNSIQTVKEKFTIEKYSQEVYSIIEKINK